MLYLVSITILVNSYEKSSLHLVEADCKDNAIYDALCGETHNEPLSFEEFMNDVVWDDDGMIYQVRSCEEVKCSDEEKEFLLKHISCTEQYDFNS